MGKVKFLLSLHEIKSMVLKHDYSTPLIIKNGFDYIVQGKPTRTFPLYVQVKKTIKGMYVYKIMRSDIYSNEVPGLSGTIVDRCRRIFKILNDGKVSDVVTRETRHEREARWGIVVLTLPTTFKIKLSHASTGDRFTFDTCLRSLVNHKPMKYSVEYIKTSPYKYEFNIKFEEEFEDKDLEEFVMYRIKVCSEISIREVIAMVTTMGETPFIPDMVDTRLNIPYVINGAGEIAPFEEHNYVECLGRTIKRTLSTSELSRLMLSTASKRKTLGRNNVLRDTFYVYIMLRTGYHYKLGIKPTLKNFRQYSYEIVNGDGLKAVDPVAYDGVVKVLDKWEAICSDYPFTRLVTSINYGALFDYQGERHQDIVDKWGLNTYPINYESMNFLSELGLDEEA